MKYPQSMAALGASALGLLGTLAGPAQAQNQSPAASAAEEAPLEVVVVTGSRRQTGSPQDAPAPVDVFDGDDFRNQGNADMVELLRTLVPSFNVNTQPISDASTVIRPVNLRGLAPDHTLVLVNGKRRHRAAAIGWLTNGVSDGAQGPDISVIPAIALQRVEVLRDGAAAQYGSDAIAGVVNFILKDDSDGGSLEFKYGQYTEGDEEEYLIAGNIGLPFAADGFFNVSFEYGESDETFRAIQRTDAQELIDAGNTAVPVPAQNWGNPRVDPNFKFFFNLGVGVSADAEAYAFGNFARKEGEGSFYYRNPNTRAAIFSNDGGMTRLVGDVTSDGSGNCPDNLAVSDAQGLQDVMNNPNCYVFNEDFPGGFTPRFGTDLIDATLVAGLRGTLDGGMNYDLSLGLGHNDARFFIYNTVNGSLGPDSPTSFKPGDYTQNEYNFNVDVSYPVPVVAFASDLNIAAGLEYRIEEFAITAGDEESFVEGPLATQGFSVGSNGFPGFPASIAGDWSRANYAAYLDLEADITAGWQMGAALRYEDFEDFGETLNGKLATFIQITDWMGVRGTWTTGFRAPTPGQQNASNTTSAFDSEAMDIVHRGTIPSNSPIAMLKGGTDLAEEKSESYTAGLVFDWGDLSLAVDYYNIELKDRIALTEDFTLNDEERQSLIAQGVPNARDLEDFRFFQNAFDTETTGLDIVATYNVEWGGGITGFNLAWNRNKSEVKDFQEDVIDDQRIREVEDSLPESRYNLTVSHLLHNWRFTLRYNYVDDWYDEEDDANTGPANTEMPVSATNPDQFDGYYDGYYTLDFEVAYDFGENLNFTLGGQNFTDEYPEEHEFGPATLGNHYSQFAPLGFNGAFFYGRLRYDF